MSDPLAERLERALGARPASARTLGGGCVGDVRLVTMHDGARIVVKLDDSPTPRLDVEGAMLRYLAERSRLPVPRVLHDEPRLLAMEFVEGSTGLKDAAQRHCAELLADLHSVGADRFGFEHDTLIGGLRQPNAWSASWVEFFRERRVLHMAEEANRAGRLPARTLERIHRFADALPGLIEEPDAPALVHGDVWSGNVLGLPDRVTAFIDPAIHYAHPEVELAFMTLIGGFDRAFFDRYNEQRPIRAGFFETRRDVYNVYPLLVHARLFGGGYAASVEQTVARFGF